MKTAIIIPAYNEEKRIVPALDAYGSYFEKLRLSKKQEYEIIVVINGTTDNTEKVVKSFSKKNKRIKYLNLKLGGKGYAVIQGFKNALEKKFDLIGFVDADLATSPEAFYMLIKAIPGHGCAIANRYDPNSKLSPPPTPLRKLISFVFNFLVRSLFLFPYRDTQCGAKLFTNKCIKSIVNKIGTTQWSFDVELLYEAKVAGYSIIEVPTIWKDVKGSKINIIKSSTQMFFSVVQLRFIKSRYRRFLKTLKPLVVIWWKFIK